MAVPYGFAGAHQISVHGYCGDLRWCRSSCVRWSQRTAPASLDAFQKLYTGESADIEQALGTEPGHAIHLLGCLMDPRPLKQQGPGLPLR